MQGSWKCATPISHSELTAQPLYLWIHHCKDMSSQFIGCSQPTPPHAVSVRTSSDSQLGTLHSLTETVSELCFYLRPFLPNFSFPSFSQMSDLHYGLQVLPAPSCFSSFIGISSSKSLAFLVLFWHLLVRGSIWTHHGWWSQEELNYRAIPREDLGSTVWVPEKEHKIIQNDTLSEQLAWILILCP